MFWVYLLAIVLIFILFVLSLQDGKNIKMKLSIMHLVLYPLVLGGLIYSDVKGGSPF